MAKVCDFGLARRARVKSGLRGDTRESYWGIEEIANKIGHGFGTPGSLGEISQERKELLKGCFERKAEDRLTVDMLKLPFVSDIVIKAEESEPGEVMNENYDEESMYYDVTYYDESSY
ncbi:hypothetical protein Vadar_015748 [Vaccinium darrowii]|uniref:Uncharacterized protein n=1 Tax=Vaccinium darrowii TaxID=229202 RepID=A0ACB7X187_9ERIC|nr:hypothetical protein Vadar_015748 [Vaccinium darrowii]